MGLLCFGAACSLGLALTIFLPSLQILDELIIAGELQESSKKSVLRVVRRLPSSASLERSLTTIPLLNTTGRSVRYTRRGRELVSFALSHDPTPEIARR